MKEKNLGETLTWNLKHSKKTLDTKGKKVTIAAIAGRNSVTTPSLLFALVKAGTNNGLIIEYATYLANLHNQTLNSDYL